MTEEKDLMTEEMFQCVGVDEQSSETLVRPSISYWQDAIRRLKKNKVAMISLVFLIFMILMCIFAPYIYPHAYNEQKHRIVNQGPTKEHIFGLDDLGRDILQESGRRTCLACHRRRGSSHLSCSRRALRRNQWICGGIVDDILMRILEILCGIPYMVVVIVVSLYLGKGMTSLMIALCMTSWTGLARLVRGEILELKESEYVMAARVLGTPSFKIITKHLIPNTMSVIIINTTFMVPSFIFSEAFLSFIGMGVQPPMTSWGAMASLGQQQMTYYPHELIFPAVAISLTMLAFNLLGDGLRDAFDPKLRQ